MINKKGNVMLMIWFVIILFIILFMGFIMIVGSSVINWVFDEATPLLTDLGMAGDANMTEIAGFTVVPLNNMVQAMVWVTGIIYFLMIIASFGVILVARQDTNKYLIGFYFALVVLLIIGAMFISNIYQDFTTGDNDLSSRLNEHTLLNNMILHSPFYLGIIAFIGGIILFTGVRQDISA